MSHDHDHSAPAEGDQYEKSDVNVTWLVIATAVCTVAVIASVILCDMYFDYYQKKLHQEMVVDRGFRLSGEVKEEATKVLSGEAAGPEGKPVLPIDKAMELMSKEQK